MDEQESVDLKNRIRLTSALAILNQIVPSESSAILNMYEHDFENIIFMLHDLERRLGELETIESSDEDNRNFKRVEYRKVQTLLKPDYKIKKEGLFLRLKNWMLKM